MHPVKAQMLVNYQGHWIIEIPWLFCILAIITGPYRHHVVDRKTPAGYSTFGVLIHFGVSYWSTEIKGTCTEAASDAFFPRQSQCWFGRGLRCRQMGEWKKVPTYMGVCYSFLLSTFLFLGKISTVSLGFFKPLIETFLASQIEFIFNSFDVEK